jgi:hypothetical protein
MVDIVEAINNYSSQPPALSNPSSQVTEIIKGLRSIQVGTTLTTGMSAAIDLIVTRLESWIGQFNSPGSETYFREIIVMVHKLEVHRKNVNFCKSIDGIVDMIKSLEDISIFINELTNPGSPLSSGVGFIVGTDHCELILAILISLLRCANHGVSPDIVAQLAVSYSIYIYISFLLILLTWIFHNI